MPKIIENLENRLVEETFKQIKEQGYGAVTIRSIANGCGVGVGTVYNYFPSKSDLLSAHMLKQWNSSIENVQTDSSDIRTILENIHFTITSFCDKYENIFRDPDAIECYASYYFRNHRILRLQISDKIRKFLDNDFTAEFIAEAMLIWSLSGKKFDEIYELIKKLIE